MYLLYCDESGFARDREQHHVILAGVSLFERQCYWIASEMDRIAERLHPSDPASIEFHGNPMLQGKKFWRTIPSQKRISIFEEVLDIMIHSSVKPRIFVCAINRKKVSPLDPMEVAFEQLISRFDQYLMRPHKQGNQQRGILVLDKSTYEDTLQSLAIGFRKIGHQWGLLRNMAEVPLFIDSRASRLIQLADLIAHSSFRHYERNDSRFFNRFHSLIDAEGGALHGLYERV